MKKYFSSKIIFKCFILSVSRIDNVQTYPHTHTNLPSRMNTRESMYARNLFYICFESKSYEERVSVWYVYLHIRIIILCVVGDCIMLTHIQICRYCQMGLCIICAIDWVLYYYFKESALILFVYFHIRELSNINADD